MKTNTEKAGPKKGSDHRAYLNRLRRVEGQLGAVIGSIESEKYCIGIIHQIKSMRSALKSLELEIIKGHLNGCVKNALMGPNKEDVESKLEEIVALFEKANKI